MLTLDDVEIVQEDFRLSADWSVPVGARVAVIGPSGAGKSTLLDVIAGFLAPTQGRVMWQGRDLGGLPPGRRPLSILFQDGNLFPHLTAARNIGLGLGSGRLTTAQQQQVAAALAAVDLTDKGERRPGALSGGEQSRVALARVLLRARPLLLLDEPFSALGPALKAQMLDLVAEIAEQTGATVLMVTHDPTDAQQLCPHTILVADGVAAAPAPTAALLADPPPALRAYLGG